MHPLQEKILTFLSSVTCGEFDGLHTMHTYFANAKSNIWKIHSSENKISNDFMAFNF